MMQAADRANGHLAAARDPLKPQLRPSSNTRSGLDGRDSCARLCYKMLSATAVCPLEARGVGSPALH